MVGEWVLTQYKQLFKDGHGISHSMERMAEGGAWVLEWFLAARLLVFEKTLVISKSFPGH